MDLASFKISLAEKLAEKTSSSNQLNNDINILGDLFGAQKRTRTSTSIRTLAPEASASTNSAIWARKSWNGRVSRVRMGVNWILAVPLFLRAIPGQRGEMASCSYKTAAVPLLKGC